MDSLKTCNKCNTEKPLSEFEFRSHGKYRHACKTCRYEQVKARSHTEEFKKVRARSTKKYRSTEHGKEKERLRARKRRQDPLYAIKSKIMGRINQALRVTKKSQRTMETVGCSLKELKIHLENSFEANYGIPKEYIGSFKVHIDHITPLNSAKTEEEIYELNHYTNLQYLLAKDNIRKSDSLVWELI